MIEKCSNGHNYDKNIEDNEKYMSGFAAQPSLGGKHTWQASHDKKNHFVGYDHESYRVFLSKLCTLKNVGT